MLSATRRRVLIAAALLVGAPGCLDLTQITLAPSIDAAAPDADELDASEGGPSSCVQCLMTPNHPGPGCNTEFADCGTVPECRQAVQCAIDRGCLAGGGSQRDLSLCAISCLTEAGIVASDDPALFKIAAVYSCLSDANECAPICFVGD